MPLLDARTYSIVIVLLDLSRVTIEVPTVLNNATVNDGEAASLDFYICRSFYACEDI